jgi:hypothetical protein
MKKLLLVLTVIAGTSYATIPTQPDNQEGWGNLHPDLIYFARSF